MRPCYGSTLMCDWNTHSVFWCPLLMFGQLLQGLNVGAGKGHRSKAVDNKTRKSILVRVRYVCASACANRAVAAVRKGNVTNAQVDFLDQNK